MLRASASRRAMPVGRRQAAAEPQPHEGRHAPPDGRHVDERVGVGPRGSHHGDDRERGGRPAEQQHRHAQEVAEPHAEFSSASTRWKPSIPSTIRSACSTISGGPSSERTPTRTACVELALVDERLERREAVEVGHVVAAEQRAAHAASAAPGRAPPGPCRPAPAAGSRAPCGPSGSPARRSPPPGRVPRGACAPLSSSGAPRQWKVTIGPLSSIRTRSRPQLRRVAGSATKPFTCFSQLLKAGATRGVVDRARAARRRESPRRRCRPRRRAAATSAAERPETHATRP